MSTGKPLGTGELACGLDRPTFLSYLGAVPGLMQRNGSGVVVKDCE